MRQTEAVPRTHHYKNMAAEGVGCGELSGYPFRAEDWTLLFYYVGDNKERAKAIAAKFLRVEYDATNIEFFRQRDQKQGQFYAKFTRGDM